MYRPVQTVAPSIKPVSLAEAKAHLDIGYSEKDTLITALIAAATDHLDGWAGILGRCLVEQTWRQDYNDFCRCLRLPLFPVISVSSVKYDDADGVEQTVSASDYQLLADEIGAFVRFNDDYSYPSVDDDGPSVRVLYKAGYANGGSDPNFTSTVPDGIKHAILLMVRHWFDNPSAVSVGAPAQKMPIAVDALLAPYRRVRF
jgi:uncharacterized phiE125 gp8 family phage protein